MVTMSELVAELGETEIFIRARMKEIGLREIYGTNAEIIISNENAKELRKAVKEYREKRG